MYGRGPDKLLLAFGGICTALSLICLFLSSVITINTFALLALSSVFVGIMYIEGGFKYSLTTYFSVALLAFLLPVDKLSFIYYVSLFGYYPVLKGIIEKTKKLSVEIIIKTVFYIIISFAGVFALSFFLNQELSEKFPWQVVAVLGVFALHIYDYCLSIFFGFYENRIRSKIKR